VVVEEFPGGEEYYKEEKMLLYAMLNMKTPKRTKVSHSDYVE